VRGQIVVCKYFICDPLRQIVWEDKAGIVFIHSEDQFLAHEAGLPFLSAVGFPIKDVFEYDEGALEHPDPWAKLKPYHANEDGSPGEPNGIENFYNRALARDYNSTCKPNTVKMRCPVTATPIMRPLSNLCQVYNCPRKNFLDKEYSMF
jgi:hypothetical protein